MIKRITLIAALAVLSFGLKAQGLSTEDEAAIDNKVDEFLQLIEQKNYTRLLDYMYPPIFEHSSKKDMFQVFSLLEQSGIELKFENLQLLSKESMGVVDERHYALIKYNLEMELPLVTEDLQGIAPLLVPVLQENFGKENVQYSRANNFIKVKGEKFLMGVEDPNYSDWMFLIFDASFKSALAKTLPASINQKAGARAY